MAITIGVRASWTAGAWPPPERLRDDVFTPRFGCDFLKRLRQDLCDGASQAAATVRGEAAVTHILLNSDPRRRRS